MLMLAIIFALTGAALGLRFKALVLVPASGFAVAGPFLTNFAYCYSPPVQALATITTVMALQIGYLLGLRLGVEVVDNFRDHVARFTAGIYLTLLAGIVLVLGYAIWQEWRQHILSATQATANNDFRPNIWDDF